MIRLFPFLALAACATVGPPPDAPAPVPAAPAGAIRYSSAPCFGTCPVYTVTVAPDGAGIFLGERNVAAVGERTFRATQAEYQAFAARLAPLRPARGDREIVPGEPACGAAPTDQPSAAVTWFRSPTVSQRFTFYYGCARVNPDIAAALRDAPALLPIADLVGKR